MRSIFAALAISGSAAAFSRLFVLSNRPNGWQLKAPLQVERSSFKNLCASSVFSVPLW